MTRRIAAVLLAAATLWLPAPALAKSYSFPRVLIDAKVGWDGSLRLVELRTFDFRGSFSSADYTVDWPSGLVRGFAVSEGGVPVRGLRTAATNHRFTGSWRYSAADEQRTFTISYTAMCAVRVYSDAAHLLWRFVGRWGVPTDLVSVTIHLPEAVKPVPSRPASCPATGRAVSQPNITTRSLRPDEVRAWGHGPYQGQVTIVDPQTIRLDVRGLAGDQYVEGSVLFPPSAVPFEDAKDVPAYDRIVAVEQKLADRANAARQRQQQIEAGRRRAAEAARRRHDLGVRATWLAVALLPIAFALLSLLAFARDRVRGVPKVLQEPPDDMHPVQLAMLWSAYRGHAAAKTAYRAQLLHLARIGAIGIDAVGTVSDPQDLTISLKQEPSEEGPDRDFVHFLFPDEKTPSVSMNALTGGGGRSSQLERWWKDVGNKASASVDRLRRGRSRLETVAAGLLAVAAVFFSVGELQPTNGFSSIVGIVGVVGWLVVLRFVPPRLDRDLRERMARWRAFRRFLKDFSSLPEAPALGVVIWEQYLVYAVALDVAEEVQRQVKALVPEQDLPAPWPGAPPGLNGLLWAQVFRASVPAFASPVRIASGSLGGGFGGALAAGFSGASHTNWAAGGFGHFSSGAGFGGGFSGGGHGFGGGLGGHAGGGTHGGAH